MAKIAMRDIALRLLTPNDTLDVRLFNAQNRMHPDVRKKLLAQAEYAIQVVVGCLPGFEVTDIVLCGSCAGYFYHENSDIDLKIVVSNTGNPYISAKDKDMELFMQMRAKVSLEGSSFYLDKRPIDIVFTTGGIFQVQKNSFSYGYYSIREDKWLVVPDKNISQGLDVDEIMAEYTKRFYDIRAQIASMIDSGKIQTMEGVDELEKYYEFLKKQGENMRECVIFKLLQRRGILKEMLAFCQRARQDLLSLKD